MKIQIEKRHMVFLIAYFVTMLTMLLYQNETLPFANILIKTRYGYILFVLILFFCNRRVKRQSVAAMITIGVMFLHTFLFGLVFNNTLGAAIAASNISINVKSMFWYLMVVLVTYLYVSQNGIFKEFINTSFYACGVQLIIAGLKHRGEFVNPVWGLIQSFTADVRYKTTFGFVHAGYLSNACFLVIVVSIFYFELNKDAKTQKQKWHFWASFLVIDALAAEMLMCAAERSGILSTLIAVGIYAVFVFFRFRIETRTTIICCVLAAVTILILILTGVFESIWADSNRGLNITVNYPIFQQLGNIWTGMGYVDNSGFNEKVLAFGYRTSSLDLYYVYIYFTTGIIGCILVGISLFVMLFGLFTRKKTNLNIAAIGVYLAWIFFSVWQCNMLTYRFVSGYVLFTIILCGLSNDFCGGEKKAEIETVQ